MPINNIWKIKRYVKIQKRDRNKEKGRTFKPFMEKKDSKVKLRLLSLNLIAI